MLITQFLTDLNRDALIGLFGLAAVKNVEAALTEKSGKPYVQCLCAKKKKKREAEGKNQRFSLQK